MHRLVAAPATVCVPGSQKSGSLEPCGQWAPAGSQGAQNDELALGWYLPVSHREHDDIPAFEVYLPGRQLRQSADEVAPKTSLYLPGAQCTHVLSLVAPVASEMVPTGHLVNVVNPVGLSAMEVVAASQ